MNWFCVDKMLDSFSLNKNLLVTDVQMHHIPRKIPNLRFEDQYILHDIPEFTTSLMCYTHEKPICNKKTTNDCKNSAHPF